MDPTTKCFVNLPAEIVRCIADNLDSSSAGCLSLCNRYLADVLGPTFWPCSRQADQSERLQFLLTLSRDLPQHFVCHRRRFACHEPARLSRVSSVEWPCSMPGYDPFTIGRAYFAEPWSKYLIEFVHVQLPLKNHRYGAAHGIPLEAFKHTEFRIQVYNSDPATALLSVEARIDSDEFLLRCQRWISLPQGRRDEFITNRKHLDSLCRHIWMRQNSAGEDALTRMVRLGLSGVKNQVTKCSEYHMDFFLDIFDVGEEETVLLVTKWTNFGAGLSPSHLDWVCHFRDSNRRNRVFQTAATGSIKERFEGQPGQTYDELVRENCGRFFSGPGLWDRSKNVEGSPGLVWRLSREGEALWYLSRVGRTQYRWLISSFARFMGSIMPSLPWRSRS